jgi:uncharacterized protein YdeI (YjbR/CyaY-like superfamily)
MKISKTLYVQDRDEWRSWLDKNHLVENEIWLIYYKQHTGKPRISYDAAVEEALCYGWIDSNIQRIDDEKYAQKFTPRKNNTNWSELNKKRVKKLIEEGKMTSAGLEKINLSSDEKPGKRNSGNISLEVPDVLLQLLKQNKTAIENFNNYAASYKKQFIMWINAAKKEETRNKRIMESVELISRNEKLGMK